MLDTDDAGISANVPDANSPAAFDQILNASIKTGVGASVLLVLQELRRACENQIIVPYMDRGIMDYIAAVGALAFTGRDVYKDGIVSLVESVGMIPDEEVLGIIRQLRFKNHLVYINSIFFLFFIGKPPTVDNVIKVVKAMNIPPDAQIAEYVLKFIQEYLDNQYNSINTASPNLSGRPLTEFKRLSVVAISLSDGIAEMMVKEIESAFENERFKPFMGPQIVPYIAAVTSLAFTGKDTDPGNITTLLAAVDMLPDEELLSIAASLHFKNYIFYLIAVYFLLSVRAEVSSENMIKVVRALGAAPDAAIADLILSYFNTKMAPSAPTNQ